MNFDTWLTYTLACAILSIIPGPSVLLIIGQALTKGLRTAVYCLAGEALGSSCLILVSLLGMGAILNTSAILFTTVKWLGVAYLAYLGITQIRQAIRAKTIMTETVHQSHVQQTPANTANHYEVFSAGFFTALLNPKAIIFYMAFISQFIDPTVSLLIQYPILIFSSVLVATLVLASYALLAAKVRSKISHPNNQRRIQCISGSFYLGGSVFMATTK